MDFLYLLGLGFFVIILITGTEGYIERDLDFDYYDFLGFTKEEVFEDAVSISFDFHNQPQEVPENFHNQDQENFFF